MKDVKGFLSSLVEYIIDGLIWFGPIAMVLGLGVMLGAVITKVALSMVLLVTVLHYFGYHTDSNRFMLRLLVGVLTLSWPYLLHFLGRFTY